MSGLAKVCSNIIKGKRRYCEIFICKAQLRQKRPYIKLCLCPICLCLYAYVRLTAQFCQLFNVNQGRVFDVPTSKGIKLEQLLREFELKDKSQYNVQPNTIFTEGTNDRCAYSLMSDFVVSRTFLRKYTYRRVWRGRS